MVQGEEFVSLGSIRAQGFATRWYWIEAWIFWMPFSMDIASLGFLMRA
jgi:hypothetical protein